MVVDLGDRSGKTMPEVGRVWGSGIWISVLVGSVADMWTRDGRPGHVTLAMPRAREEDPVNFDVISLFQDRFAGLLTLHANK